MSGDLSGAAVLQGRFQVLEYFGVSVDLLVHHQTSYFEPMHELCVWSRLVARCGQFLVELPLAFAQRFQMRQEQRDAGKQRCGHLRSFPIVRDVGKLSRLHCLCVPCEHRKKT